MTLWMIYKKDCEDGNFSGPYADWLEATLTTTLRERDEALAELRFMDMRLNNRFPLHDPEEDTEDLLGWESMGARIADLHRYLKAFLAHINQVASKDKP